MLHRKTYPGTRAHPPGSFVGPPRPRSRGRPPTIRGPRAPQALRGRRIVPALCGFNEVFRLPLVLPSARWLVGKWAQSLCINTRGPPCLPFDPGNTLPILLASGFDLWFVSPSHPHPVECFCLLFFLSFFCRHIHPPVRLSLNQSHLGTSRFG